MWVKALNILVLSVSVYTTFFPLASGEGSLFSLEEWRQGREIMSQLQDSVTVQATTGLSLDAHPAFLSAPSLLTSLPPCPLPRGLDLASSDTTHTRHSRLTARSRTAAGRGASVQVWPRSPAHLGLVPVTLVYHWATA